MSGGRTCTVGGYGGLALLGSPGQGVPTDVRRNASPAPTTLSLPPGGSARSLLHWTVTFIGRGRSERVATEQQVFARMALARQKAAEADADRTPTG